MFFTKAQTRCRCTKCDGGEMAPQFMRKMERLRFEHYKKPLIVSSGFRCKEYDTSIGGKGNHSLGVAMDLVSPGNVKIEGADLQDLLAGLDAVNIKRVIMYKDSKHIHIDDHPTKKRGTWIK